jgi:restriction endonuclease S subunit
LRKCLVENFNVREIISVPQDQFENTSTKTSIIIFNNTKEKTSKVIFYDLDVKRYTDDKFEEIGGEIVITENKDDICGISDKLVSEATKDEILKNSEISLTGKDYSNKEIIVGDGYKLVKIGDISDIKSGKAINSENRKGTKYPYYAANGISGYVDEYLFDGEYIICAQDGSIGATHYIKGKFYASNHVWVLEIKDINLQYIYFCLKYLVDYKNYTSGSVIPKITKKNISSINIPIPVSKQKINDLVNKISKLYNKNYKECEHFINELKEEAIPSNKQIINKMNYLKD